jgi:hypothetical protein
MPSEPHTVYVVVEGYYSDQSVVAVFSDEATAGAYAASFGEDEARVEPHALDAPGDMQDGRYLFHVSIARDGSDASAHRWSGGRLDPVEPDRIVEYPAAYPNPPHMTRPRLVVYCYARDEEQAVKIANERRTVMVASGQWPEGGV